MQHTALQMQNEELQKNLHLLEEVRNRYWELYEFAPMGYFCLNEKNVIIEVNLTGARLLGMEKFHLLGKRRLSAFIADDYSALFYTHCHDAFKGAAKKTCEVQIKKRDGSFFYAYLESITAGGGDAENNKQLRVSMSDVTERKLLEEKAQEHQLALQKAAHINSVGGMTSAFAHELTQPLTAINNYVKGCVRRIKTGNYQIEELLDIMQHTAEEVQRVGKIVHTIKEFVRKGKPHYTTANIHEIIQTTLTFFRKELASSRVEVGLKLSNTPLYLMVDAIQIELVLLNFLRNGMEAMKNMPQGHKQLLSIHTEMLENNFVKVSVMDTGHGLEKETLEKVFDPYFTTKHDSLGMGLWICRSIIEAHGGQLTAEPVLNGGACFVFILPSVASHHV